MLAACAAVANGRSRLAAICAPKQAVAAAALEPAAATAASTGSGTAEVRRPALQESNALLLARTEPPLGGSVPVSGDPRSPVLGP